MKNTCYKITLAHIFFLILFFVINITVVQTIIFFQVVTGMILRAIVFSVEISNITWIWNVNPVYRAIRVPTIVCERINVLEWYARVLPDFCNVVRTRSVLS